MADLFGDYKRPNAERKVIEKYIKIYEKSKNFYTNKNYTEALEGFKKAYQLLLDIWDQFPKIVTLYLIMKSFFYTKQYDKCQETLDHLETVLEYIPKEKFDSFIKIKSRILIYRLILYFINDDIDNSVDSIIGFIKYLSSEQKLDLEEKAKFFWYYIKCFLKIAGITNTNKFSLLKEGYNSMIVEQVKINENNVDNKEDLPPEKKINRLMIETYKNFMNSKLRSIIYESLDKEFYFVKYRKENDKVMIFLHKNINIFVRDNNKERLMELFHTFLVLNKTNLKRDYNMTLDELVFEQKRRIEAFDRIFSNLVGAFNHIFRPYFADELPNLSKKLRKNSNIKNYKININELKNLIKIKIQSPEKEIDEHINEKKKQNNKKLLFRLKTLKVKEKDNSNEFNFIKEIKIPPNSEEMDKKILLDNYLTKRNYLRNNLKFQYTKPLASTINNFPKKMKNDVILELPKILDKNNMHLKTERDINYSNKRNNTLSHRNYKPKYLKKKKTESELENASKVLEKKNDTFKLRNINNYLITKLIENFLSLYNIEHSIPFEENIDLSLIYPRKKDIFNLNIPNFIKSYSSISFKGTKSDNQDNYFYYNNYFLIKNITLFGVCDGHGKNGKEISHKICILFPSYLFYILLDDNLLERKLDINNKILKLMKLQESPDEVKNMFLLRYFFNKFEIDLSSIPLISGNENLLFNQIHESLYYSEKELVQKYEIETNNSGTTLCSGLIYGNILYIINIGDSRAVLGSFLQRVNKWKATQLSVDHKPNEPDENKRIISYNGRVERFRNEFGEEYGVYRVVGRENDSTYPGLAVSRSIGDEDSKKLGVILEPDVFKYELNKRDKLIVIASDGLWENISNEEVINIVGNCLNNDIKCEEAANILVEKVKNKILDKFKNKYKNKEKNKEKNTQLKKGHSKNIKLSEEEIYNENKKKEEINKYLDNITCIVIYLDIK